MVLEDRIMLAAQPVVSIDGGGSVTLGETTTITLTFDNQPDGSPGSNVGYAPYIDLAIPQNGADGAGVGSTPPFENDGLTFVSATYLGQAIQSTVLEFDVNGEATHPFARDATGALRVVRAADYGLGPGDQLAVLTLPYGSFTADQTPAQVSVTLQSSNLADVNVPLPISAQGGFAFGRDALNNPTTDPPVLGPIDTLTVTPTLLQLSKSFSGRDGETVTGPNFPESYTLSLDIAPGQTLQNLVFRDRLADGIVVTNTAIVQGPAGTLVLDPLTNDLTVTFAGALVGVAGTDVRVRVDFFVGEFLTPGQPTIPVLDPATGAPRPMLNDLSATADWTPIDPRDPPTTVTVDPPGPENVFTARALSVQKSGSVVGGGAPEPGDTIRWTLTSEVSDFFTFGGLVLTDTLSDGQRVDPATPFLTVREGGAVIYAGAFDPANVTITLNPDGTTSMAFRVSDELAFRGLDPELSGGRVGAPTGAATFDVTFESEVQRFYANGAPLLQGDGLGNNVAVAGILPGSGAGVTDTGNAGLSLERGFALNKSIYLVNGQPPISATPPITNADVVVFRLQYTLPTGSANNFTLTDFLPLPVLQVDGTAGPLTFVDVRNDGTDPATIPAAGSAWFHPDETFDLNNPVGYAGQPDVILNVAANSITFDFGDFYMPVPTELKVDILFRLPIEDRPFGDNLFLTNLVTSREENTPGQAVTDNDIVQIVLTQPALNITKGVIGVTTGQTQFPTPFDPATIGPVPFQPPGTAGAPFAGTITSAALDAAPIDSNLAGVDAGDLVRFALVVENTGSGIRGAHDILIRDSLPAGFEVPPGGLNLTVTRGDGTVIPFVLEGAGLFDPAGGIRLLDPTDTDPLNLDGALTRLSPATAPTGSNLALITYDLRVADATAANGLVMTNTTEIAFYAAQEGGADFAINLLDEDRLDDATVSTGDLTLDKVLVSTSLPESTDPFVLIGEEVVFRITASIREGLTQDLVLTDLLPTTPGILRLLDWTLVGLGTNLTFTGTAPPLNTPQGVGPIRIDLGDVTNLADNVFDARDQVVFEVRALVDNVPQNNRGDVLVNRATASFTDALGNARSISDSDSVTIAEPGVEVTKVANRATADAGDIITYTVTVTNPVTGGVAAPVFDLNTRDIFNDPDLFLVPGSVALSGSAAASSAILLGNNPPDISIRVFTPQLDPGQTLIITYQGRISDVVQSGRAVLNTAIAQGDSAPGDVPGQRVYEDLGSATVRMAAPTITKVVQSTSLPETGSGQGNPGRPDLAFGEEVVFRVTTRFAEGTTTNATLRDVLPTALPLEVLSATVIGIGANLTVPGAVVGSTATLSDRNGDGFNDSATLPLGTVLNTPDGIANAGDLITLDVVARLRGDLGAAPGVTLTNRGELNYFAEASSRTVNDTAAVETVLPRLTIEKAADRTSADGGDVITYTVRLRNTSVAFAAPAFDMALVDALSDPDLQLVAGSVTVSGVPATIVRGNNPGDTSVELAIDRMLIGETLLLTYQATISPLVAAGSRVDNTAEFVGDTYPGAVPGQVLLTGRDSESVSIGVPSLTKVVSATSLPETGSSQFNPSLTDVAIGETVFYTLTVTLPEAANVALRTIDQFPVGAAGVIELLSYSIAPLPPTTNLDFVPGTEIATFIDSDGDGVLDRLEVDFGTVTNVPDNRTDQDDQIVIGVVGRVIDVASNSDGRVLTNFGQTFLNTLPQDPVTASVEVVEPRLIIAKSASIPRGDAGDVTTFTVTVLPDPRMTGPAFNVRLTDLVPPDIALLPGTVITTGGTVIRGNGPADDTVEVLLPTLLPGSSAITVTFEARLLDTVQPGQILINTADLDYRSAPSFARDYDAQATAAIFVAMAPGISKDVVVTTLPETSFEFFDSNTPDVAVGESVIYRITATLGEGTQTLRLNDVLPGAGNLRFIEARVDSIGANISGSSLAVGDPGVLTGNTVAFDFGTVVNAGDNVIDDRDQVAIVVRARVADIAANIAGRVIQNDGVVNVGAPSDPAVDIRISDPARVEVVEPRLAIFKDATPDTGDAGDEIEYRLTVVNVPGATGPAYELILTDLLPAGMTLIAGSVVADRGSVVTGNAPGDTTIRVSLATAPLLPFTNPQTPFDDTRVIVTYRARLDDSVEPGQLLVNDARYAGVSAPVAQAGIDARPLTGNVTDTVTVVMPVTLDKQIVATSLPETGSGAFDPANPDLAIGETITYQLTATLSEGTQTLVIEDLLPAGLVFDSGRVVSVGAGLPPGLTATPAVAGQRVTFDFGTVVNTGNNVAGDGTVVVEIIARVANVPGNVAGTVLTNAGTVTVASPTNPGAPGGTETATDSTSAEVVEPAFTVTKTVDRTTGDAGDVFTYTVTVTPDAASTGPAYDVVVTDVLDPILFPISAVASTGTASISGQTIRLEIPLLLPTAAPVVLTYQVRFTDAVEPGQVVGNVADLGFNSAPGAGRPGTGSATGPDLTGVFDLALDKTIIATSFPETGSGQFDPANPDLAIGEEVTYQLVATLSEGTQTLVIADTLPAGLVFVSARVAAVGAGLSPALLATAPSVTGQVVTFDFGTVVNTGNNVLGDGTVTVEIVGRVDDVAGNQSGTVLSNAGSAVVTSPTSPGAPGGTLTATDSTDAEVVTPALVLDKSTPPGFARPGEIIPYTLTLAHTPGSTAPAYDLVIADALTDANLELVTGSVVASAGTVVIGNNAGDTTVRVELAVLDLGQVVTVTFNTRVALAASVGGTVTNTATGDFDTAPGPGGRPGNTDDGASVPLAPGFDKTITATSIPQTVDPNVAIGEQVTYELVVTLPQGAIDDLIIADLLPAGLSPLSATVLSVGGGITGAALAPGAAGTITGQQVRFDFGDIVNTSPPAIDDADRITVQIVAEVANVPGTVGGTVLANNATVDYVIGGEAGQETDAEQVVVGEPALAVAKSVDRLTGDAGDIFTYNVTLTPGGTAPAFDVVVTDLLDPVLFPISATSTLGTATITGQTVRLEIPVLLPTDPAVILTYQVRFADTVEPGRVVGNTANLGFDSAPGPGGRPDTGSASAPDLTAVFGIDLTKAIVATSLPETGAGFFDPTLPDIAIGESVTYELVATLSEGTQRVVLRDVIPDGMAFVPGSFTVAAGAGISAGAGGTLTPIPVLAGTTATLDFGTLVNTGDNVTDAGDRITVRFQAIALDDPLNVEGRLLRNDADIAISSPLAPGAPGGTVTDTAFADAEIVVVVLALEKSVVPTAGDAGDLFTYTLTLDHLPPPTSTAPAYLVLVQDVLPAPLVLEVGSLTTSFGIATAVGNTISVEIPLLLPDDPPVVITFQARFSDAVEPGQVVTNVATVAYASAPGAVSRPGADDATATINANFAVQLTKQIVDTSLPGTGSSFFDPTRPDLAIGETVTYRLVATLSEGTQRVVISDQMPVGLVPEAAQVIAVGAGLPLGLTATPGVIAGQGVTFDFGTVINTGNNDPADGTITVEIVARVADVAQNQAGRVLENAAQVTAQSPGAPGNPGGTITAGASAGADVVTPVLVIDKSVDRVFASLGEPVTYTLLLRHDGASTAPAYNVVITDPLSGGALRLIAGSVTTSLGTVVAGNGGADSTVQVNIAELAVGQTVVITSRAAAVAIPAPDGVAPNTGSFGASSAPGGPPGFVRPFAGSDTAFVRLAGPATFGTAGGLLGEIEDFLARERPLSAAPFSLPPVYSGTAAPGTQITLAVRDASGAIVGQETRVADVGGNWLVSLPGMAAEAPRAENTGTLQAASRLFAERDLGLNNGIQVSRAEVPNTAAGGGMTVTPSQTAALFAPPDQPADSTRVYFAGPASPFGFDSSPAATLTGGRVGGVAALQPDVAAATRPFGLALNKFALDFLAGSTVPGGRLN
jgi:fimbrial isopeptide formation D2 family protein/uncharacterized repeat protein (TIGR01451 family)